MFLSYGDGLKNYFTSFYYLTYDHGTHFSGMNYPFGEHITFTDGQPSLMMFLNFIDDHVFSIHNYTVGIMNELMLFSFVICAVVILFILRFYGIKNLYSCFLAVGIAFMSPQLERIVGHYSLVYAFIFPLLWYWFLRLQEEKKKWFWLSLIIFCGTFFGMIHLYLLMIATMFLFFYSLAKVFFSRKEIGNGKQFLFNLTAALIPFILVFLFQFFTDHVKDRPQSPWGFFVYHATFRSVFLPIYSDWIMKPIDKWWGSTPTEWEGYAYVGAVGTMALIFTFSRQILRIFKLKKRKFKLPLFASSLYVSLFAAFFVLLFSMAIPFEYHLHWLYEKLNFLKQFRSPGRFAWCFYYVFTIYAVVFFYQWSRAFSRKKSKLVSHFFLITISFLWLFDASGRMKMKSDFVKQGKVAADFFNNDYKNILESHGWHAQDFQAILPLPFYEIGNEKFGSMNFDAQFETLKASYNLHLPVCGATLSRTSLSQALLCSQIVADPMIEKKILELYPNKKPLLLIAIGQNFTPSQNYLIQQADSIWIHHAIRIYKLDLSKLQVKHDSIQHVIDNVRAKNKNDFYLLSDTLGKSIQYRSFDEGETKYHLMGGRGWFVDSGKVNLFDGKIYSDSANLPMEFSIWVRVIPECVGMPLFYFVQYDQNGKQVFYTDLTPAFSTDVIDEWLRFSYTFMLQNSGNRIQFYARGDKVAVDEMLIRPTISNVVINNGKEISLNNFPVK